MIYIDKFLLRFRIDKKELIQVRDITHNCKISVHRFEIIFFIAHNNNNRQSSMYLPPKRSSPELVSHITIPDSQINNQKKPSIQYQIPLKDPLITPRQQQNGHNKLFIDQLGKSSRLIKKSEAEAVHDRMQQSEQKIYDYETGEDQGLILEKIYKKSPALNDFRSQELGKIADRVQKKVVQNVIGRNQVNQRPIPKSKDDLKELEKVDRYRLLKIKNGQIKNKLGNLRNQLEKQYFYKKQNYQLPQHQNVKISDYYDINHPRTKEANEFISALNKKRNEERLRYQQYTLLRQEEMRGQEQEEKMKKYFETEERRKRLEKQYFEKELKRKQDKEELQRKRKQYEEWSKKNKKEMPLFERKQYQHCQKLIQQIDQRQSKLREIKQKRRPMDYEELNMQELIYLQSKRDEQMMMENSKIEKRESQTQEKRQQYYKGKYRYLALESMMNEKMKMNEDPREKEKVKKARQIVYADEVNERLHAQIALRRQDQFIHKNNLSARKRGANGSVSVQNQTKEIQIRSASDPKNDGKRNLKYMHDLVKQKGVLNERPKIRIVAEKHVYPDYLSEARYRRKSEDNKDNSLELSGIDLSMSPGIKQLIAKQKKMDQMVKRGHIRRKHNTIDYREDANIEQKEIQGARLKLKIFDQLK